MKQEKQSLIRRHRFVIKVLYILIIIMLLVICSISWQVVKSNYVKNEMSEMWIYTVGLSKYCADVNGMNYTILLQEYVRNKSESLINDIK